MLRRAESSSHCHVLGRLLVLRNVEACTCDKTIRPAMLLERSLTPKTFLPTLHPSHRQQNPFKKCLRQAAWILAARAGAKAGSHDTHDVTWPRCNSESSSHCHVLGRLLVLRNVEACTCDKTIRPAMLLERSLTPKTFLPTLHPSHRQQNPFKKCLRQAAWILAARAGAKAGSHDTHDVTWPRCNSLGYRP